MFTTMTTTPAGAYGPVGGQPLPHQAHGQVPAAEQTLLKVRTHPKILIKPVVAQVILLALHVLAFRYMPDSVGIEVVDKYADLVVHGLLFVGELWFSILPALHWHHSTFEVTDRRIRQRWGILTKRSREIHLDRITQVNEDRSLMDRLFRCGSIIVYDAANASAITFNDVPKFHHVRETIDTARHNAHLRAAGQPQQAMPPGSAW